MSSVIRAFEERDQDALRNLSLRAWEPVFTSLENILGDSGVFARLHPDWRADQRQAVDAACNSTENRVWVAEVDGAVAGFTVARLDRESSIGEIYMMAVDPDHQGTGIGSELTAVALDWIKNSGMSVAMVETGDDPGHAPARKTYEQAGFTKLPLARYFKKL